MENKCVSCGADIPEGRMVCPNCEANTVCNGIGIKVSFSYGKNPCLHIKDSYLVKGNNEIKNVLRYIHGLDDYKKLQEAGYTRTFKSEYREWKAHNLLYRIGILKWRTGTTDFAQNESKLFRFGYAILSIF